MRSRCWTRLASRTCLCSARSRATRHARTAMSICSSSSTDRSGCFSLFAYSVSSASGSDERLNSSRARRSSRSSAIGSSPRRCLPPREWQLRVEDILDAIAKIDRYVEGLTFEQFQFDEKTLDAVVRNLEVIGERCGIWLPLLTNFPNLFRG